MYRHAVQLYCKTKSDLRGSPPREGAGPISARTPSSPSQSGKSLTSGVSMISRSTSAFIGLASAGGLYFVGPHAWAQGAAPSDELEEIVVTAEKVSTNLQKTAVSVATVSGADLTAAGKTDLSGALKNIPAVTIDTGPAGFLVRIRGAGLDVPPTVGSPAVAISRDGAFDGQILDTFLGFYDVDHVEVLRGPQGTLYGRSATGGAVNIVTNKPVDRFETGGALEVGNYNLVHIDSMVNIPLDDVWSMRIAGTSIYHKGYLSNGMNSADNKAGRFKLQYKPNENTAVLLGAEYGVIGGTASGTVNGWGQQQPSNPWLDTDASDNWWTNRTSKYYLDIEQNLGFAQLTILPSYQWLSGDWHYHFATQGPLHLPSHLDTVWNQKAVEARLSSLPGAAFTWVVGYYYYDNPQVNQMDPLLQGQADGMYPTNPGYSYEARSVKSQALYAQFTYPIIDSVRLTGGVRGSKESEREYYYAGSAAGDVPNPAAPTGYYSYMNASDTFNYVDFKGGVEADLAKNSLGYLQVSTAHLPGGFNVNDDSEFVPEHEVAYELGSKNRFLSNTLQVNAEIFDNEYTNFQVAEQLILSGPPGFVLHIASASARSYGGEVETDYLFTQNDRLNFSAAYLHARYETFAAASQQVNNGSPLPVSPNWTLTAGYQHTFDIPGGGQITPYVGTRYETAYYLQPGYAANLPPFFPAHIGEQYPTTVSNARITYAAASGLWELNAHINNIENHALKETMFGPSLAIGEPRTFGLTFTWHFDANRPSGH